MDSRRFFLSSLYAMMAAVALYFCMGMFHDFMEPRDGFIHPPIMVLTEVERVFDLACLAALWPLVVTPLILGHDPAGIYWLLPWAGTGLFWGFVAELVFIAKAKARKRPKALVPN